MQVPTPTVSLTSQICFVWNGLLNGWMDSTCNGRWNRKCLPSKPPLWPEPCFKKGKFDWLVDFTLVFDQIKFLKGVKTYQGGEEALRTSVSHDSLCCNISVNIWFYCNTNMIEYYLLFYYQHGWIFVAVLVPTQMKTTNLNFIEATHALIEIPCQGDVGCELFCQINTPHHLMIISFFMIVVSDLDFVR